MTEDQREQAGNAASEGGSQGEVKKEQKKDDLWIDFKVEVPAGEIEKQIDEIARKYSTNVKLPGFRKGKVPVDMVKNLYKDAISGEALDEVLEHFIYEKVQQDKLNIIPPPVVENIDYKEGGDLKADVRAELFPQIELPRLEEIRVKIPKKDLKPKPYNEAEQIDAVLESRKRRALVRERGIQEDDILSITFQSKMLETKRMTPKKSAEYRVNKETEFEILNLYEEVLGKLAGEKVVFKRKYPADYRKKVWAGKEIEHYVAIDSVHQLVKPELDNEFLKAVGFQDEESFKKKLKEEYEELAKREKDDIIARSIIEKIMEVADFPVPQTLIDKELQRMMPPGKKFSEIGKGEQENEYLKLIKENAGKSVKSMLVFDHIRREFKIEVSNDDLEKEYRQMADKTKYPLGEIRKYYANSEQKEKLKDTLLNRKLLDFLREKIQVKEV